MKSESCIVILAILELLRAENLEHTLRPLESEVILEFDQEGIVSVFIVYIDGSFERSADFVTFTFVLMIDHKSLWYRFRDW